MGMVAGGACSFDAHGGMVNYPSGHCAFRYTAATGVGQLYDCGGQLTRTVGGAGQEKAQQQGQQQEEDVQFLLDAHLVRRTPLHAVALTVAPTSSLPQPPLC